MNYNRAENNASFRIIKPRKQGAPERIMVKNSHWRYVEPKGRYAMLELIYGLHNMEDYLREKVYDEFMDKANGILNDLSSNERRKVMEDAWLSKELGMAEIRTEIYDAVMNLRLETQSLSQKDPDVAEALKKAVDKITRELIKIDDAAHTALKQRGVNETNTEMYGRHKMEMLGLHLSRMKDFFREGVYNKFTDEANKILSYLSDDKTKRMLETVWLSKEPVVVEARTKIYNAVEDLRLEIQDLSQKDPDLAAGLVETIDKINRELMSIYNAAKYQLS